MIMLLSDFYLVTLVFTLYNYSNFNKFCLNILNIGTHKDRTPAKQSLLCWPCSLPPDRAIGNAHFMAEDIVEYFTYAHSGARPVSSLTSPVYDLPPTVTIHARRLINTKRPTRLEPRFSL